LTVGSAVHRYGPMVGVKSVVENATYVITSQRHMGKKYAEETTAKCTFGL